MSSQPWRLPESWRWAQFRDVAHVASNLVDPAGYSHLPHIAPNHIEPETGKLLPYTTVEIDGVKSSKHRFYSGQVLYSKIRPYLAKAIVADFDGLCSADMYPIESELDSHYLKWWMLTREFTRQAAGQQARTVLPKINKIELYELPVPVPPPKEQRCIAETLECHLSRLNATAKQLQLCRTRLAVLEDQTIRYSLSGGSLPRHPSVIAAVGFDDGQLPDLPEKWTWTRLGEVADVVGGVTKDAKKQSDTTLPEWPYLRVANVQRGWLDLSQITKIRAPTARAESLFLRPGDVLLNEGGDRNKLGRGWVWDGQIENCIHQNHVFRARVRGDAIKPHLLSWAANTFGGTWCERNGKQSVNLASISLSRIKLMPVPLPPRNIQPALVRQIDEALTACRRLVHVIDTADLRSQVLRRGILAAAFAGLLTGRSTETEVAEEMAGV